MELWWNLDILWWNLDSFEHKFDGNITNWPCWSEGKLGTGPFTWLGQGFQTNFSEIPFQKRENLSIYGQNYGQLRSNGDFWRSCNRKKKGFIDTPVFCNASRNRHRPPLQPLHNFSGEGIFNHMSTTLMSIATKGHSLVAADQWPFDHDLKIKDVWHKRRPPSLVCLSKQDKDYEFISVVECSQGLRQFSNIFTH